MRILILEDDPIIAIDIDDILTEAVDAECVVAPTVSAALASVEAGVDFALLDINIGHDRNTCFPVAAMLVAKDIPFCFVSCSRKSLPGNFNRVPFIAKPFRPSQITDALLMAA